MKYFIIGFGLCMFLSAIITQASGVAGDYHEAVYHHIWWAFCGGVFVGAGLAMD